MKIYRDWIHVLLLFGLYYLIVTEILSVLTRKQGFLLVAAGVVGKCHGATLLTPASLSLPGWHWGGEVKPWLLLYGHIHREPLN